MCSRIFSVGGTAHKDRGTDRHCNSDNWERNKKLGIITKWISLCCSQVIAITCTKEFHNEFQALHEAKSSLIDFLASKPISPPHFFPSCAYYRGTTLELKSKILPQTHRMLQTYVCACYFISKRNCYVCVVLVHIGKRKLIFHTSQDHTL